MPTQTALLAALAILTPQSGDEAFCDRLKLIVAAAPGRFVSLGPDAATRLGSLDCGINRNFLGRGDLVYECEAPANSALDSGDVQALAERTGRCLGTPMVQSQERGMPPAYSLRLPGATIGVSYDIRTTTARSTMYPGTTTYTLALRIFPPDS